MEIRALDLANETELRQWHEVRTASTRVERPDFVPRPFEEAARAVTRPPLGAEQIDLVALDEGSVVGTVHVWLPTEDNLATGWLILDVDPPHRRRGIGRELVREALAGLPAGRTEILMPTVVPHGQASGHHHLEFAEAVGFTVSSTSTIRDRTLPVPADLLGTLSRPTPGYRVETHVGGVPEILRESLGVLKGLVDVDAPSGDVEWEASPLSPEHYAEELRRHAESGRRVVESLALVETTDEVVAYSELVIPSGPERPVEQEGTFVRRDHRGHGLGVAVKVAALRALTDLAVASPAVRTENDDENTYMVAINDALGFVPVLTEVALVRRLRPAEAGCP